MARSDRVTDELDDEECSDLCFLALAIIALELLMDVGGFKPTAAEDNLMGRSLIVAYEGTIDLAA